MESGSGDSGTSRCNECGWPTTQHGNSCRVPLVDALTARAEAAEGKLAEAERYTSTTENGVALLVRGEEPPMEWTHSPAWTHVRAIRARLSEVERERDEHLATARSWGRNGEEQRVRAVTAETVLENIRALKLGEQVDAARKETAALRDQLRLAKEDAAEGWKRRDETKAALAGLVEAAETMDAAVREAVTEAYVTGEAAVTLAKHRLPLRTALTLARSPAGRPRAAEDPWANTGDVIAEADRADKVGDFDALKRLCAEDHVDLLFYAISETGHVFSFCEADVVVGRTTYSDGSPDAPIHDIALEQTARLAKQTLAYEKLRAAALALAEAVDYHMERDDTKSEMRLMDRQVAARAAALEWEEKGG